MHIQLHLKATWKDTKKLLPVLTLERGLGWGGGGLGVGGRGEDIYPATLLHKERVWVLSAQLKIDKICNQKRESSWSPSFTRCIFPPISF